MSAEKKNHLIMVDVIKGICIIMVILTHVTTIPNDTRKLILYPFTILPAVPIFLMLSGFTFSMAEMSKADNKSSYDIAQWFDKNRFFSRFKRFFIPYLIADLSILLFLILLCNVRRFSFSTLWKIFIFGGRGPGGYYVILLMEFLVLFPFLLYGINKSPFLFSMFIVCFYIAYETLCRYVWNLEEAVYNRLVFHYILHILLGLLLYKYKEKITNSAIPLISLVIGIIYIINVYYWGYKPLLGMDAGSRKSFGILFSFGLICYLLQLEPWAKKYSVLLKPISYIGKASYHILLAQMVFFYFARYFHVEDMIGYLPVIIVFDLVMGLTSGCLFYAVDTEVRNWIALSRKMSEKH